VVKIVFLQVIQTKVSILTLLLNHKPATNSRTLLKHTNFYFFQGGQIVS
jgi:hypothetical protein